MLSVYHGDNANQDPVVSSDMRLNFQYGKIKNHLRLCVYKFGRFLFLGKFPLLLDQNW